MVFIEIYCASQLRKMRKSININKEEKMGSFLGWDKGIFVNTMFDEFK